RPSPTRVLRVCRLRRWSAKFQNRRMPSPLPVRRLDEVDRDISVHALDPHWRGEIDAAATEDELIALARKYMQRMPSIFVARLPEGAPPPRVPDTRRRRAPHPP